MKTITLPGGEQVAALGVGTWCMGEDARVRAEELATLQLALDLGATLIDTAEMYGEGRAEALIAEAIGHRRDEAFIVSKVYPHNASRRGAVQACERSLKRLKTDRIDLYLLHWRGDVPFADTLAAFESLQAAGKIRHFGVSNLDFDDTREWCKTAGGQALATNQLLYNLTRRGIEWDLLPWLRERKVPVMAYSPVERGKLLRHAGLKAYAQSQGMTPAQMALAWLLAQDGVIVIPKTSRRESLRENMRALAHALTAAQRAELDRLFPPPSRAQPLEML